MMSEMNDDKMVREVLDLSEKLSNVLVGQPLELVGQAIATLTARYLAILLEDQPDEFERNKAAAMFTSIVMNRMALFNESLTRETLQ